MLAPTSPNFDIPINEKVACYQDRQQGKRADFGHSVLPNQEPFLFHDVPILIFVRLAPLHSFHPA